MKKELNELGLILVHTKLSYGFYISASETEINLYGAYNKLLCELPYDCNIIGLVSDLSWPEIKETFNVTGNGDFEDLLKSNDWKYDIQNTLILKRC